MTEKIHLLYIKLQKEGQLDLGLSFFVFPLFDNILEKSREK
jgi:hypothetical protein